MNRRFDLGKVLPRRQPGKLLREGWAREATQQLNVVNTIEVQDREERPDDWFWDAVGSKGLV